MGYTAKELALHRVKVSKWLKGEADAGRGREGRGEEEEEGKEEEELVAVVLLLGRRGRQAWDLWLGNEGRGGRSH